MKFWTKMRVLPLKQFYRHEDKTQSVALANVRSKPKIMVLKNPHYDVSKPLGFIF